jgi:hypothetical protein
MHAEHIRQLIERFREQFVALTADEIQRLVEEARTEALAEARALLKEQMLQAILEHSATLQTQYGGKSASAPSPKPEPTAASQRSQFVTPRVTLVSRPETPPEEPAEAAAAETKNENELDHARKILKEIETLRQQLSQNEDWLSRLRPSEASSASDTP